MSTGRPEPAAQFQLRKRLGGLLALIEAHKVLPSDARTQPSPRLVRNDEPLAPNLFDYSRKRVTDDLRSTLAVIKTWKGAIPQVNKSELKGLRNALRRMLGMLHPAQEEANWRDGEIPQRRHLSDPCPEPLPARPQGEPRTPRLAALKNDLDDGVFQMLFEKGMTPIEVEKSPERAQLIDRLSVGEKALFKRERRQRLPIVHSSDYPKLVQQRKELIHAHKEFAGRVEAWENAEATLRWVHAELSRLAGIETGDVPEPNSAQTADPPEAPLDAPSRGRHDDGGSNQPRRTPTIRTIVLWEGAEHTERNIRLARTRTAYLESHGNVSAARRQLEWEGTPVARSTFYEHLSELDAECPGWRTSVLVSGGSGNPDLAALARTRGKQRG